MTDNHCEFFLEKSNMVEFMNRESCWETRKYYKSHIEMFRGSGTINRIPDTGRKVESYNEKREFKIIAAIKRNP